MEPSLDVDSGHSLAPGHRFYDEIEALIAQVREHPRQFRAFDPPAYRSLASP